ncbi:MAG: amidohydrolase family protein [Acidimicrobiales bacterium]
MTDPDIRPRVDVHAHFFPPIDRRRTAVLGHPDAPWLRRDSNEAGYIMTGDVEFRPVQAPLWDPEARLDEMDRTGVTVQVMSATPILFSYGEDAAVTARWAAALNDLALEMCTADPQRLRTMCQVPLQDIDRACVEVSRSVREGHVGVHIGNHVQGRNLDDPELVRFLHYCAGEGIPVFVHPWDTMAPDRMPDYMLKWLVGMPAETHLAILSLILSGAFERLPADLRICFAHGGGNFASQIGRVDNAWRRRDLVRADCPALPSSYTDRFWVDSAVFSPDALRLLISVMGSDRILMGSDYPFPLGEIEPGTVITDAALDDATTDALQAGNAAAFFGIELPV